MAHRTFGEIGGNPEGTSFESRDALHQAGVHLPTQAGISGSQYEGADSIVMSGGYEDDEDHGDLVIYTGHGGQDSTTRKQIADQEFTVGNKGLAISCNRGFPLRVVRGSELKSAFAPEEGYRYDGLYNVEGYWSEIGKSGYRIWRFRLVKADGGTPPVKKGASPPTGDPEPGRQKSSILRTVRDTAVSQWVKDLYRYSCQICGIAVDTPTGPYAEGGHLKPLGRPHNGPDVAANVLCLCPNHHVQMDKGALSLTDELRLIGADGNLTAHADHKISLEHVTYHRERIFIPS